MVRSFIMNTSSLLKVIYNPLLTDDIFTLADQKVAHTWLQEKDAYPLILSVGRLDKEKDFAALIKAFAILSEHNPARLMILGEGALRSKLEELIANLNLQDKVSLPGYVDNPYVFMKNCSLFVLPSNYEGLPGVLIEALDLSPRIVATDCPGGTREILDNGKYGKLVKVGDVEGLASAMLDALKSEPQQCDAEFLARFKPETVVPQYLQVLLNG